MFRLSKLFPLIWVFAIVAILASQVACAQGSSSPTPSPESTPSRGAIVDNGSLLVGEIKAVKSIFNRYPWEVEILVNSVQNVNSLPNPISDRVGQIIACQTDENMGAFKVGQIITGNVKLSGDVERGTIFYLSNIK